MATATILGSNGVEASVVDRDIIREALASIGWTQGINYGTKRFEFFAIDDIQISINGLSTFTLKAGDEIEETDEIFSFVLKEADKQYRYYAKF